MSDLYPDQQDWKEPECDEACEVVNGLRDRITTLESQLEQARTALEEAAITMNHARTFITSRQKMHATGVALYDELLSALQALREGGEG